MPEAKNKSGKAEEKPKQDEDATARITRLAKAGQELGKLYNCGWQDPAYLALKKAWDDEVKLFLPNAAIGVDSDGDAKKED
jgi:hypothetical protein